MALSLVAGPTEQPVSLDEAKAQCRLEADDDNGDVEREIASAMRHLTNITGQALTTQTWELQLDAFPKGAIELPLGKVQSVSSVKYYDASGTLQTLAPSLYRVNLAQGPTGTKPARVTAVNEWPDTTSREDAVLVQFVAGWTTDTFPDDLKQAALMLVSHWYENRELVYASNVILSPVPYALDSLVKGYVLPSF